MMVSYSVKKKVRKRSVKFRRSGTLSRFLAISAQRWSLNGKTAPPSSHCWSIADVLAQ